MKVRCKHVDGVLIWLTVGKVYEVISQFSDLGQTFYRVVDDTLVARYYSADHFETV